MDQEKKRINVVVIGEKNSGKTSIISSLYKFRESDCPSADGESKPVSFEIDENESKNKSIAQITAYNSVRYQDYKSNRRPTHALLNTKKFLKYIYKPKVYSTEFEVSFWDTPALSDIKDDDRELLDRLLSGSDVIIVAIDTPSIMERHRCKAEVETKADACAKMLRGYMQSANKHKMVIFVPTRCEKYYSSACLREVTKRVQELYRNFFVTLNGLNNEAEKKESERAYLASKKFAIITPLTTMRRVTFTKYRDSADLESAEFCMNDLDSDKKKLAQRLLIGIANFLILQGMCQTAVLKPYTTTDRALEVAKVAGLLAVGWVTGNAPHGRIDFDKFLYEGEWEYVSTKELIPTEFDYGYKEFYS